MGTPETYAGRQGPTPPPPALRTAKEPPNAQVNYTDPTGTEKKCVNSKGHELQAQAEEGQSAEQACTAAGGSMVNVLPPVTVSGGASPQTPSGGLSGGEIASVLGQLRGYGPAINQGAMIFGGANAIPAVAIMAAGGGGATATTLALRAAPALGTVAAAVVPRIPAGMQNADFGRLIGWGRGTADALSRIGQMNPTALLNAGVTRGMAIDWARFYVNVAVTNPGNPSAPGRAELMYHIAYLLR